MKKVLFVTIAAIGMQTAFAQNTPWSETAANIGIGTLNPISPLQVHSSVVPTARFYNTVRGASGGSPVILGNYWDGATTVSGDRLGSLHFSGTAGSSGMTSSACIAGFAEGTYSTTNLPASLRFYTIPANAITLAERMRITPSGDIGIGTSTPTTMFQIHAPANVFPVISLSAQDVNHSFTGLGVNAKVAARVYGHNTLGGLVEQGYTDGDNVGVRIQGHIGGIATPTRPGIMLEAFKQDGTGRKAMEGNELVLLAGAGDLHATPTSAAFSILGNGNVGIGTTVPKAKLAVNGDILSKKVKVTQLNWPDYVFQDDYKLPSLAEVEKHIQQHGHLQGIPSAEEVKMEGIDVGEQQAALLKKVEELTLYVIEQNKKLEQQGKEIEVLRKEIRDSRKRN